MIDGDSIDTDHKLVARKKTRFVKDVQKQAIISDEYSEREHPKVKRKITKFEKLNSDSIDDPNIDLKSN